MQKNKYSSHSRKIKSEPRLYTQFYKNAKTFCHKNFWINFNLRNKLKLYS